MQFALDSGGFAMHFGMCKVGMLAVIVASAPTARGDDNKESKKPPDAEITRLLIGKWKGSDPITGVTGTIQYAKDGTFIGDGKVSLPCKEEIAFHAEGTWKVSKGAILFTITKSTRPGVAPVGIEVKEVVYAIDEKTVRYKRGLGKVKERTRLKE
jgi:hypothetical protein